MINEYCSVIQTPVGEVSIYADLTKVSAIYFKKPEDPSPDENEISHHAAKELKAYFEGTLQKFSFPIAQTGTEFQQKVWELLKNIPFGTTLSYAKLSDHFGNPKAIRAIASANGKNKLNIIVPCHRVIGSSGKLVGYGGGLWRKQWLLNHENEIAQQGQLLLNF